MGNLSIKEKEPELKYQGLGESDLPSVILELVLLAKHQTTISSVIRWQSSGFFHTVIENRFFSCILIMVSFLPTPSSSSPPIWVR